MFDLPDQIRPQLPVRSCPVILCPACRSTGIRGMYDINFNRWIVECSKCGTSMEIPSVGTDLESACELLNRCERLGYEVDKSKEEAKNL